MFSGLHAHDSVCCDDFMAVSRSKRHGIESTPVRNFIRPKRAWDMVGGARVVSYLSGAIVRHTFSRSGSGLTVVPAPLDDC